MTIVKSNGGTGVALSVFHRQVDGAVGSRLRLEPSLHADDVGTSCKYINYVETVSCKLENRTLSYFRTFLSLRSVSAFMVL